MPQALIVAHGQPSDPMPAEAALAQLAQQVQGHTGIEIGSATLAAPNALEHALATLDDAAMIYPVFMTKGWFVTQALPKRMGTSKARILDPFGQDPELPRMAAAAIRERAASQGWAAAETDILLAAHGSGRSRNPARLTAKFGDALQDISRFRAVHLGFVEEEPTIQQAAEHARRQCICLPYFAFHGGHVQDDLPAGLQAGGYKGEVLPVLGALAGVPALIARAITAAI